MAFTPVNMGVSSKFSDKPIHWITQLWDWWYCPENVWSKHMKMHMLSGENSGQNACKVPGGAMLCSLFAFKTPSHRVYHQFLVDTIVYLFTVDTPPKTYTSTQPHTPSGNRGQLSIAHLRAKLLGGVVELFLHENLIHVNLQRRQQLQSHGHMAQQNAPA